MSWFPAGPLTVPRACGWVLLIWAGVYLPALGALELKHEEPRRALPAVGMLATGDWLVPRLGSRPCLRKPPLLNWSIAASFRLSGGRSEGAARLPSVLATLALALTVAAVAGRAWLGAAGGLLAAIFCLTNLALMEIGRLAELEALYIALTGIALTLWLTAWRQGAGPWRLWLWPTPFLALAMLTKGPTHLIFYYGILLPVLVLGRDVRDAAAPRAWVGAGVGRRPVPRLGRPLLPRRGGPTVRPGSGQVWWREIASRAAAPDEAHFHPADWLLAIPLGLKNFLPWTVLLPVLWHPTIRARLAGAPGFRPRDQALFRGARFGMGAVFVLLSLLPKGSPRYLYPLLTVPCLLLAWALTTPGRGGNAADGPPGWLPTVWDRVNAAFLVALGLAALALPVVDRSGGISTWVAALGSLLAATGLLVLTLRPAAPSGGHPPAGWRPPFPARQSLTSAAVMVLTTLLYAVAAAPRLNVAKTTGPREVAAAIRAAVPNGARLWVEDSVYQPFWFYLEPDVTYFHGTAEVPVGARFFLLPAARAEAFPGYGNGRPPVVRATVRDGQQKAFVVLERPPPSSDVTQRFNSPPREGV